MPNVIRIISPFIVNGNPDTMNVAFATATAQPYAPGDLGASFDLNDKTYEVVLLDSGATAASGVGAVAAGQVAFWKSKTARIVTNDSAQSITPASPQLNAAGIFRSALVPGAFGSLICILCRGNGITVAAGTTAVGPVQVDSTASTARVITATSTNPVVGIARTTNANNVATVDVDIPTLP